jgi:lipopolysaccharide transport system permease protein
MDHPIATHETVIAPKSPLFDFDLHGLWSHRYLLRMFIWREFSAKYKQTILGPLWFFIQPLIMAFVFSVVFGRIAKMPTGGVPGPLFYMTGLLAWNFFNQSFNAIGGCFLGNAHIISKVYFPRMILPLAFLGSQFFTLAIQFVAWAGIFSWYFFLVETPDFGLHLSRIPWLLFALAQLAVLAFALGLWFSALTAKYRDLIHLQSFMTQVWLYLSPVIYPLSRVPPEWKWLVGLNPVAGSIEIFRWALLGNGEFNGLVLASNVGLTIVLLFSGMLVFNRTQDTFVDSL